MGVLARLGVRDQVPASVLDRLQRGLRGEIPETPKPGDRIFDRVQNVIIGNNQLVVEAAVAEARRLGVNPHVLPRSLEGEAHEAAGRLVAPRQGRPR